MQMGGGGVGLTEIPEIQLDISKGTTLAVGGTITYKDGTDTMKVTKGPNVSTGSVKFNFYIHSLPNGGKFNVSNTITIDANGKTGTLQGGTNISDVYEVYYYKKVDGGQTNGALKVKTSSDTKIFYKDNVSNGGTWTKYIGTNPPDEPLQALVNQIKDQVEIKIDILLLSLY